jgi:hypothetical protein
LKGVVDAARCVGAAYRDKSARSGAVVDFQRAIGERINFVVKFCRTNTVKFEVMLCSLLVLARGMEGILYDVVFALTSRKEREYAKLPLKSVEQIYAAVEANIEDEYVYSKDTSIIVLDSVKRKTELYELDQKSSEVLNSLHPIARGTYIYDLYKQE